MTLFVTDLPISAYIMLSTIRFLKWVTRNTLYCQFKILFVCRITILMTFQQGKACYKQILKGLFQLTLCQIEFFSTNFSPNGALSQFGFFVVLFLAHLGRFRRLSDPTITFHFLHLINYSISTKLGTDHSQIENI